MSDDYAFNRWPSVATSAKRCRSCSTLEAQLAEVTTKLSDTQNLLDASFREGVVAIAIEERDKAITERDTLRSALKTNDEEYNRLSSENDTLRTALRQVAEALEAKAAFVSKDGVCFCSVRSWLTDRPHEEQCQVALDALALPVVQAVLKTP